MGGKIAYFDMCSVMDLNLLEMEAMIAEVGIVGEKVDLWYLCDEAEFTPENLSPLETERDISILSSLVE